MGGSVVNMASLMRVARQGCRLLSQNARQPTRFVQPVSFLSTSKKNKDADIATYGLTSEGKKVNHFEETDDNWMSYGYSLTDKEEDRVGHNLIMFCYFTLCIFGVSFIFAYMPDHRLRDWGQREGYLELARREKAGLPLIDPNLI